MEIFRNQKKSLEILEITGNHDGNTMKLIEIHRNL